ncbi:MAG: hypothetical protein KJ573_00950 [Proteobacteria bacterium]|jgi:hypothetical protein|nr:hypothetical protein [Desulfobacterales bacterium]MBL7101602.1 hypothetical protein [Desulfobacteraceae bacterium]MBU0736143.1 hypothetical protein [Pseudomonadota bacterium]MBL7171655.1 hypothetical protein [Desulfobacteraceae bacterium]MBU0988744.1 hypothetical protein [Pseudomonadota bacterium]
MKKAIVSPLCSALIIPGLGQIINQDLKKGIILLGMVFLLFVAGTIKLIRLINSLFKSGTIDLSDSETIISRLRAEDPTLFWYMGAAFAIIWFYSVLDAYVGGKKIDQSGEGDLSS